MSFQIFNLAAFSLELQFKIAGGKEKQPKKKKKKKQKEEWTDIGD